MRTLKNREAIVEKLAEMLKKFDMQLNWTIVNKVDRRREKNQKRSSN